MTKKSQKSRCEAWMFGQISYKRLMWDIKFSQQIFDLITNYSITTLFVQFFTNHSCNKYFDSGNELPLYKPTSQNITRRDLFRQCGGTCSNVLIVQGASHEFNKYRNLRWSRTWLKVLWNCQVCEHVLKTPPWKLVCLCSLSILLNMKTLHNVQSLCVCVHTNSSLSLFRQNFQNKLQLPDLEHCLHIALPCVCVEGFQYMG